MILVSDNKVCDEITKDQFNTKNYVKLKYSMAVHCNFGNEYPFENSVEPLFQKKIQEDK